MPDIPEPDRLHIPALLRQRGVTSCVREAMSAEEYLHMLVDCYGDGEELILD